MNPECSGSGVLRLLRAEAIVPPGASLEASSNLFESGLIDSYDAVRLIAALERSFSVAIDIDRIDRGNFSTAEAIAEFIDACIHRA